MKQSSAPKAEVGVAKPMSREQFTAARAAAPEDIAKIEAFARNNGLTVVRSSPERRSVMLSGTVAAFDRAFSVKLEEFDYGNGVHRGRTGPVYVPLEIADIVDGVFGLDDRPQAAPRLRPRAATRAFTPIEVGKAYSFPSGLDGTGQCIAIIELGGGYRPNDLNTYFHQLGLNPPNVSSVLVDGAQNNPEGNPDGADGEVMLDIEVAGAVAPKAKIVVYFAPNTDRGFLDAITKAIHDTANNPSVISISWGGPEINWTAQAMRAFDNAFGDAGLLGVSVCVASGDNGSSDGVPDGKPHVDFPASSPNALGCGGTRLVVGNGSNSETVWNDGPGSATGGGVSDFFPLPSYQSGANVPVNGAGASNRGVPDVAGDADPETGYRVRVDGVDTVIGGTSAVAPLWAGLIALLNQGLKRRLGFLNPALYDATLLASGALHDIMSGNNGDFSAGPGWDPCTGLGTPDGTKLLSQL